MSGSGSACGSTQERRRTEDAALAIAIEKYLDENSEAPSLSLAESISILRGRTGNRHSDVAIEKMIATAAAERGMAILFDRQNS
ncbi:hypothetical protein CIT31_15770 [Mesorhizobium wenxiniae]|uniref:Uncharacterized protein n=1 Tax=Mesorhizobium wenxiniae TaxID=2014805 RepID=A0A271KI02_9HYPH|nr:hypothetical protein CIT31_15770 [Mesorhizobium wenxiniae]